MPLRGYSAWGSPVYSDDDPVDFLHRWLRMSWVQALCGRQFDETGDTFGWYLCAVRDIDRPVVEVREGRKSIEQIGTVRVQAEIHVCLEDSALHPDTVFETHPRNAVLLVRAELRRENDQFQMLRFEVRPTTEDMLGAAARYGAPEKPYIWYGPNRGVSG